MLAHNHLQKQHQIIHQNKLYVLIPQQDASAAESERAANEFCWFGGVVISSVYNIWIYPLTNCGILCRNNISISARHALSSQHSHKLYTETGEAAQVSEGRDISASYVPWERNQMNYTSGVSMGVGPSAYGKV